MFRTPFFLSATLFFFFAQPTQAQEVIDTSDFYTKDNPDLKAIYPDIDLRETSIVALKLFPEKYNGEMVKVKGYLSEWAGFLFIFPTQEGAQMENISVGLMVGAPERAFKCKNNFVSIRSRFLFSEENLELGLAPVDVIFTYNFEDSIKNQSLCFNLSGK